MKITISILFVLISQTINGQALSNSDSVEVRILNKGKYYIKEHTISIAGKKYTYSDIWKNKYSDYKRLPYIWQANNTKTVVIIKQIIRYDKWMNVSMIPFDHNNSKPMIKGRYTIEIRAKRKKDMLEVEETLVEDK
jgi:hypothetical protein